ncbi:MAG: hypothetical protein OZSIB_3517 [Candidatus Ozemobacter sibiricus]|uniref:Uncharacterized protein n=1 Tax=Candidatus Ozemobacter sibiricus TaxID=2268124 RepID=A0A367ZQB6_9BACT|nr:MAG: hypothetical protein OZSIB_3517 [Candidatus Ozemobacter sibiricus]
MAAAFPFEERPTLHPWSGGLVPVLGHEANPESVIAKRRREP